MNERLTWLSLSLSVAANVCARYMELNVMGTSIIIYRTTYVSPFSQTKLLKGHFIIVSFVQRKKKETKRIRVKDRGEGEREWKMLQKLNTLLTSISYYLCDV